MNKIIITWDGPKMNVDIESYKPIPTSELIGILEYVKLTLFEKREEKDES